MLPTFQVTVMFSPWFCSIKTQRAVLYVLGNRQVVIIIVCECLMSFYCGIIFSTVHAGNDWTTANMFTTCKQPCKAVVKKLKKSLR